MEIVDVKSYNLVIPHENEYNPIWNHQKVEKSRKFTLVIVCTNEGIYGISGGGGHFSDRINNLIKPFLIGKSPFEIEKHLKIFTNAKTWFVEIALWDIIGEKANLPLYKLWGSARSKVMAYASTCITGTPAERAEQAKHYKNQGFKALKIRFNSKTLKKDLRYLDEVIDAVGENIDIMVDANQATPAPISLSYPPNRVEWWDYQRAFRTAKELENRNVVWLEEPLGRWCFDELTKLTKNTEIYIAGGEMNWAHEFKRLITEKCYDIIQPDPTIAQTLSQTMRIKALCESFDTHFVPHHGMSGIGLAVNAHLLCAFPGWTYIEYMYDPPYRTIESYQCLGGIITTPLRIDKDGYLRPPSRPGLGIEIDEKVIKDYVT